MDFHAPHLPLRREAFDVPLRILRAFRMDRPERNQALSVLLRELADEPVHILREAHHFGRDVVDQARPFDAGFVEVLKERSGVIHESRSVRPIRNFSPQQVQYRGFQGAIRFHVHVDIRDPGQWRAVAGDEGKSFRSGIRQSGLGSRRMTS